MIDIETEAQRSEVLAQGLKAVKFHSGFPTDPFPAPHLLPELLLTCAAVSDSQVGVMETESLEEKMEEEVEKRDK